MLVSPSCLFEEVKGERADGLWICKISRRFWRFVRSISRGSTISLVYVPHPYSGPRPHA